VRGICAVLGALLRIAALDESLAGFLHRVHERDRA
jgi:hypothetical protein